MTDASTDEMKARHRLERSWFEKFVADNFDTFSLLNTDGIVIYAQVGEGRYDSESSEGKPKRDLLHVEDLHLWDEALERVVAEGTGAVATLTARHMFPSGCRWMEVRLLNMLDSAPVNAIVCNGHDATDQIELEALRRNHQSLLEAHIKNSVDSISVVDAEGTIVQLQAVENGYDRHELIGQPSRSWVHPDDVSAWDEAHTRLVAEGTGATAMLTSRYRFPEGYRWMESRHTNLLDDPLVRGIIINACEVTDRVETANSRDHQLQWFEALVRNSFDGISVLAVDGSAAYSVPLDTHTPDTSADGRGVTDWCHPDDTQSFLEALKSVADNGAGATTTLTTRSHFPDGYRWVESRLTNLLDDPVVKGIVNNYRDVTERREFETQLEHQATHDTLTGLPNRALVSDRIDQALTRKARHGGTVALLFLDLDGFKAINDAGGHEAGDQLLVSVGQRLRGVVRATDTVSRLGGDEFVVLTEDDTDADTAAMLADRIREALRQPTQLGIRVASTTASIGIALSSDGDKDAATLLTQADAAMYQAKRSGRDRVEIFDAHLRDHLRSKVRVETELRGAVGRGELRLHYQPVVDTVTGAMCATEALVRWQHPERGLLVPGEFLQAAEDAGLIATIDKWVLKSACMQALRWDVEFGAALEVASNLSAKHLVDPELAVQVAEILEHTGLEPGRLCLEITETALIDHPAVAAENVRQLRRLGVKVALDDFGTGYSSMTHLKNMHLSHIKIDRSFIAGLGTHHVDSAIVRSTIGLAHELDLVVVAEGVETAAQLEQVKSLGADFVQGMFVGPPQPAEQLVHTTMFTSVRV